jgi:hypothetical protein
VSGPGAQAWAGSWSLVAAVSRPWEAPSLGCAGMGCCGKESAAADTGAPPRLPRSPGNAALAAVERALAAAEARGLSRPARALQAGPSAGGASPYGAAADDTAYRLLLQARPRLLSRAHMPCYLRLPGCAAQTQHLRLNPLSLVNAGCVKHPRPRCCPGRPSPRCPRPTTRRCARPATWDRCAARARRAGAPRAAPRATRAPARCAGPCPAAPEL